MAQKRRSISESSDDVEEVTPPVVPGRPLGSTPASYTNVEKLIAFQALMRECPANASGAEFLKLLQTEMPSRSSTALQSFISRTMRQHLPSLFSDVYKNDWSLLSERQRLFLMSYMREHADFLATMKRQLRIDQMPSTSRDSGLVGVPGRKSFSKPPPPLKLVFSTPKKTKPSTFSDWPALSPLPQQSQSHAMVQQLAESIATSVLAQWQDKQKAQSLDPQGHEKKIKVLEDPDESLNEDDLSSLDHLCELAKTSDEGLKTDKSYEESEPQLRARISTITLVEIFKVGYKGRDSPFIVRQRDGEIIITHKDEDTSACSTAAEANFGRLETSALDSIIQLDAVSLSQKDSPLTPLKLNGADKSEVKYRNMRLLVQDQESVPVFVKVRKGVELDCDKDSFN